MKTNLPNMSNLEETPDSILIVGSGLFGLSTAWALTKRSQYDNTIITIVDNARGQFPPVDAASVDTSRIIRADYADPDYSALGALCQDEWRKQKDHELGGQGRYSESGFLVMASASEPKVGKKTGMEYVKKSWENVDSLAKKTGAPEKVTIYDGRKALQDHIGTKGAPGDWGYLNKMSGWADNGAAMKWLYEQVEKTGRINFVDAEVKELVTEGKKVIGAMLKDGGTLRADVVFLAAGAWTGALIDIRGRCEATGHALGYIDITQEEQELLEKREVFINFTNGLFTMPPRNRLLKVARHAFGYLNPQTVTNALPPSHSQERKPFVASIPWTLRDEGIEAFGADADRELRWALKNMLPIQGLENRPWRKTRLCWYSDTRDANWLVDWHPGWEGLFVATGDSGHGFKFLPVIGGKLVDVMEGHGGRLGEKWKWRHIEDDGAGKETNGVYKGLITDDGSRGGLPGLTLKEVFKNGGRIRPSKL